jgi:hypothetical protein
MHKSDQPDALVDFLDAEGVAGQGFAEIDLFAIKTKAAAAGDHGPSMSGKSGVC